MAQQAHRSTEDTHDLSAQAYPKLSEQVIKLIEERATQKHLQKGEVFFETAQLGYDFAYIKKGQVNIVDRSNEKIVLEVKAGNFLGELGMLMGQKTFLAGIASEDTLLYCIPQKEIMKLVSTLPQLGDVVVRAFAARRKMLLEWNEGGIVIIGKEQSNSAARLISFVDRSKIPYRYVDAADQEEVAKFAKKCSIPESETVVVIGNSEVLCNPEPLELAVALGLDLISDTDTLFDVVIIGAGPSGLASAIYAASEGLKVLVVEDTAIGGQAGTSSKIENYLGFPTGIAGGELAYRAEIQAIKFGARLTVPRRAVSLKKKDGLFYIGLNDERCVRGKSVVLANGIQYRRLSLDRLQFFENRGIYYAATKLEAKYCIDRNVVIVGGGNSAGQAAMFLCGYAKHTYIVVRGRGLSETMSSYLAERIEHDERIDLLTQSEVSGLGGETELTQVTITQDKDEKRTLDASALFIMIGAVPNTEWLPEEIRLDQKGFVHTAKEASQEATAYETSLAGVYAIGDIRSGSVKRVAASVGEGSVVVSSIHEYLKEELSTKIQIPDY